MLKKILSLLLVTFFCFCLILNCSSCENKEFFATMELDEAPKNLDPQIASDINDLLIIRNLYEGLMRYNNQGVLALGAAKSYTVSDDGLTYNFILRDDILWSDGETKLTAHDFAFAFKRTLTSEPKTSFNYLLSGIKEYGAKSETEFYIKLKAKNDNFLDVLTYSVCMPCNEQFFLKAKGKYGLDFDHVLSNGSFYLKKWESEGTFSMRISADPTYNGNFLPQATSINFSVQTEESKETRIAKNYTDFGFVSNPTKEYTNKNLTYTDFYNTSYCLVINPNKNNLNNQSLRVAIEKSVHRNLIENNMPKNYMPTYSIVPNIVLNGADDIKNIVDKIKALDYDPKGAIENFRSIQSKKSTTDISGSNIIFKKDDSIKTLASTLAESWQQTISGYVNIQEIDNTSEFTAKINTLDYDFAIVSFAAETQDIYVFLEQFLNINLLDSTNSFKNAVQSIKQSITRQDYLKHTQNALNILNNSHMVIPLVQSATSFVSSGEYNLPVILPKCGYIDFALITKN